MLASNPLIQVTPGLMIWTIVCFLVVLLRPEALRVRADPADDRRSGASASSSAIDEADRAREEARNLLEEHRKLIGQAKSESEEILAEARRVAESQRERVRAETEEDRQRRLEETRRQIEQATHQALGQIREEVGKLSLLAAEKITRKSLDRRRPAAADRRGARRDRLQRSSKGAGRSRRAPHLCARRLRGGAGRRPRSTPCTASSGSLRDAFAEAPRPRGAAREPRGRLAGEGGRARARRAGLGRARRQLPAPDRREGPRRRRSPRSSTSSTRSSRRRSACSTSS